jgi:serine/threonine protein kinase/tetratricopeptide (TPR) repeat protein
MRRHTPTAAWWDRVTEVFTQALDLEPGKRRAFLRSTLAAEPDALAEAEALLAAHMSDGSLDMLAARLAGDVDAAVAAPGDPAARGHIGRYQIRGLLGSGGMGIVYLAEYDAGGFSQRVAVKVLRAGGAGALVPRFLEERRILASLNHGGIPRFIDGGVSEGGAPYFAMEFIEGTAIDRYCDAARASLRRRLALFASVCDTIHYAHQHLVVHRDLKPSNILVTNTGEVKVLDFGIAKLLAGLGTTEITRTGQRWMTPEYASPEQLRGEPITTSVDVYTLGVLLYELVTGRRAHVAPDRVALERRIVEDDPPRPSEVITAEAAAARGTNAQRLKRAVQDDVDTIILKALHKDPAHRYITAAEFGDDIRRFLAGLPVRARPDTTMYRTRKFIQRNRRLVVVGVIAAVSVLGATAQSIVSERRQRESARLAALERDKAEQVSRFVVGLFAGVNPLRPAGSEVTAREMLDSGAVRVKSELANQPAVQGSLLAVLASSYEGLGKIDEARNANDEAIKVLRMAPVVDSVTLAAALVTRARMFTIHRQRDSAKAAAQQAIALLRALARRPESQVGGELSVLADAFQVAGDVDSADVYAARAVARARAGTDLGQLASALSHEAALAAHRGHNVRAESLLVEIVSLRRRELPPAHPEIALALGGLGNLRAAMGKLPEARADLQATAGLLGRSLGKQHVYYASTVADLARVLERQGELEHADRWYREAIESRRAIFGDTSVTIARVKGMQASVREKMGKLDEAESMFRESLTGRERSLGNRSWEAAMAANALANFYRRTARPAKALPLHEQAAEILRSLGASSADRLATVEKDLKLSREAASAAPSR